MSATKTRKERQFEEREQLILDVARNQLNEAGYYGLNMDRIALETEYSKGTIYLHFKNKEDVLMGLAAQTMQTRQGLFSRAAEFKGRSRERVCAIGMAADLFVRLYPEHFRVEQILRTSSIRERTSENRRDLLKTCESRCMSIVSGVVRDGISQGDLALPDGRTPEDLTFGLWGMSFGCHLLMTTGTELLELGVSDAHEAMSQGFDALLDGYGWKPLFAEWDYTETESRIAEEVFAEELALIS